jgi:EAL domain-containing protein (putative c-di-GMP-specific phosphodiesterase class I)/GGDEF domain-containing protein
MSLIKQLWLAIILVMSLAFSAGFFINTMTSKHSLEQELEMKNTDNAVSLALSMSQMKKDPVAINLMLSAQFDNGHYQYIRLIDPNGKIITERINNSTNTGAPQWFSNLIHINPLAGVAQIQDGWTQYGTLTLASATDFAYQNLWNGTLWMLFWSAAIALVCGVIGSLILKIIVRPLNEMVEMTEAIGDKNFITIKEPKTIEFRTLARGMNRLSQRIKDMLRDQSQLLDQMRIEANYDAITGLMNRKYFSSRVAAHIANEENFSEGVLVISHISNLAEINESLGNADTDAVLKRMGMALQAFCNQYPALLAGRLTGADFAVFSNEPVDSNVLCGQVKNILNDAAGLETIFDNFALPTISSKVNKSEQLDGLKKLIAAIKTRTNPEEADIMELIDQADITKFEDSDEAEWRTMLTSALEAKRLKLASFPVMTNTGEIIHEESPARLQLVEDGTWHPAGEFIAWATQLGLVSQLDHLVLEVAVKSLVKGAPPIGLNVSTSAMCNPEYVAHIQKLLKRHPEVTSRLWLEVPEHGAFQNLPQFREFCSLIKPLGCKLGVEHVGAQIGRLGELHDLNLDYIKVDASVIRDIDQNPGNKAFLKGICLIAHSIGLITIAEGVQTPHEMAALPELGIDAMTGPAVKMSAPDVKN